ncbi:extracellular solute-binding protein [Streptomyces sp. RKAG293]|uniref:extracellular solute-binding protein n=1 Tax=Streptomyces sp. RKAG293 TaxID=2893403 RepID=UPI00203427E1|nr:extracellular solute-binding protein [Streptomyces sp. RKAG293]MCM2416979.1 extracellular solute-binding protein [Streptomyces sp. RKAG293]
MSRTGRRVLAALLPLLVCVAAACSSGGPPGPPPDDDAVGSGGPIVVASGLDVTGSGGVRQHLIEEWNRQHAGSADLQAELVELPGAADQQRSQLLGALQSGSAHYDVVNLDITWIPEFAAAGLIRAVPATQAEDPDLIGQVAKTADWKGRTYAKPFNSDVGLLFYRPDYLRQAGVDLSPPALSTWQWSTLGAIIEELDGAPPSGPRKSGYLGGWTTQLAAYEGLTVNVIEAFESVGVHLTDEEGHYTADPRQLKAGLVELGARAEHVLPAARSSDESASLTQFGAGQTAFLRFWPYGYGSLAALLPPTAYSVTRLPGSAVLGGQNLAVTADSPRAAHARALIDFLTSPESERCLLDAGFAATRVSAYDGSARPCWPKVAETLHRAATAGEDPARTPSPQDRAAYRVTLLQALQGAVQRPRTPYYGAFTQILQSSVHAWLTADRPDVDATAAQLDAALRAALSGH